MLLSREPESSATLRRMACVGCAEAVLFRFAMAIPRWTSHTGESTRQPASSLCRCHAAIGV